MLKCIVKTFYSGCTYYNGRSHRGNDLPATIYANGDKYWHKHGLQHRDNDLPAVMCANGDNYWVKLGLHHRDNGLPATVYADGRVEYWENGKRTR